VCVWWGCGLLVSDENETVRPLKLTVVVGQEAMTTGTLRVSFPPGTSVPANMQPADILVRPAAAPTVAAHATSTSPTQGSSAWSGSVTDLVRTGSAGPWSPTHEGLGGGSSSSERVRAIVEDAAVVLPSHLQPEQRIDILFPIRVPVGTATHAVRSPDVRNSPKADRP
jgi:hypothetical protein